MLHKQYDVFLVTSNSKNVKGELIRTNLDGQDRVVRVCCTRIYCERDCIETAADGIKKGGKETCCPTGLLEPSQQVLAGGLAQVEVVVLLIGALQVQRDVLEHQDVFGSGLLSRDTCERIGFRGRHCPPSVMPVYR